MEPLKLDYDVDIVVPPSKITNADLAAISRALAKRRKAPGYAESLARLDRTIDRVMKAQARNRTKERQLTKRNGRAEHGEER